MSRSQSAGRRLEAAETVALPTEWIRIRIKRGPVSAHIFLLCDIFRVRRRACGGGFCFLLPGFAATGLDWLGLALTDLLGPGPFALLPALELFRPIFGQRLTVFVAGQQLADDAALFPFPVNGGHGLGLQPGHERG